MPKQAIHKFTHANTARLIRGGQDFFSKLIALIGQAKQSIHFQVYIFDDDPTGQLVADALIDAASRNVKVYLLLDRYGSGNLSTDFIEKLTSAGIHFRWFGSITFGKKFYLGRRLHHKIIVIDSMQSLVCGLNISDRYNDTKKGIAWLDWAVVIKGKTSLLLEEVCKRRMRGRFTKLDTPSKFEVKEKCSIKICVNDWIGRKKEITNEYLSLIRSATSDIIIMSPYFLPGYRFRKALKQAAKRGVNVQLILAKQSDISVAKYAERYIYEWLLKHQIEIHEYQKTILHGKMVVSDDLYTSVGSYNVNNLSAYASIELNVLIKNEKFTATTKKVLQQMIAEDCEQITSKIYTSKISGIQRLVYGANYLFLRFLLFLFTIRPDKIRNDL